MAQNRRHNRSDFLSRERTKGEIVVGKLEKENGRLGGKGENICKIGSGKLLRRTQLPIMELPKL